MIQKNPNVALLIHDFGSSGGADGSGDVTGKCVLLK
jgi:hypothetical protein